MTEKPVQGAFGATDRIDLGAYKHAIRQAPELLYHLAALVTPGAYSDGQPTAKDMQAAPARLSPLDELEAVFSWLWREAGAWIGQSSLDVAPIGHMVRRDDQGRVIGSRWIISDETDATRMVRDARVLVGIILKAWPTIEAWAALPQRGSRVATSEWMADVDEALLGPLRRWPLEARAPVRARPRTCPVCGEADVWARLDDATGVCAACEHVIRPDVWMLVADAAKILDVSPRTVRDWITGGLPSRDTHRGRMVELGAARTEQQARHLAQRLGLPSAARS